MSFLNVYQNDKKWMTTICVNARYFSCSDIDLNSIANLHLAFNIVKHEISCSNVTHI